MNKILNDNWCVTGTDFNNFCSEIKEIDARTRQSIISTDSIGIFTKLSPCDPIIQKVTRNLPAAKAAEFKNKAMDSENYVVAYLSSNTENNGKVFLISKKEYLKSGNEALWDELQNNGYWITVPNEKHIFVSEHLLATMSLRAGLSGSGLQESSKERNAFFVKRFLDDPQDATLIIREEGETKKAFAMLSGKYSHIPQEELITVVNSIQSNLGTMQCKKYEINNRYSEIHLYFPDIADDFKTTYNIPVSILPGLILRTSDCGDSSLIIQGVYHIANKSEVVFDELRKVHKGKINFDDIVEAARKIYGRYTELPERLLQLMSIDVSEPTNVIKAMAKKINLVSAIGKKTTMKLVDALVGEVPINGNLTAYDIVMNFITIPERIQGLPQYTIRKLQKAVNACAYVDFDKLLDEDTDDEEVPEQIVLA